MVPLTISETPSTLWKRPNPSNYSREKPLSSYDIEAHFTSVPVVPALNIIHTKLQQDTTCHNRTPLSIPNIMSLQRFCLKSNFFTFQDKYYKQVKGAAMGSPLSPVVDNLFMGDFETRDLSSSPNPPRIWLRFVDDTFVIYRADHTQQFHTHLSSLDPTYNSPLNPQTNKGFFP